MINAFCGNCRFWDCRHDDNDEEEGNWGRCCIRSTPDRFPLRHKDEWCGEHQQKDEETRWHEDQEPIASASGK